MTALVAIEAKCQEPSKQWWVRRQAYASSTPLTPASTALPLPEHHHFGVAACLCLLGLLYQHFEEPRDAQAAYLQALASYTTASHAMKDSLHVANVYNNLATLFDDLVKLAIIV